MELINATRMVAGYTLGVEPSGRELLVVVVKGTFHLPSSGEAVRLHETQLPLIMADTFTGAPGLSAPYAEVDFAPRKPRCDILLQGSAHAPGGRPAERVPVGIRIGAWTKTFAVVGERRWQVRRGGIAAGAPEPFAVKPITYDGAFGGVDTHDADPARHAAYAPNPVGRGYHQHLDSDWIDGSPLPDTEELRYPVEAPNALYRPMALGPVGRGWEPRFRYAGTYDQDWLDNHYPFLPPDFDEQYFQAAPADQQLCVPLGGEVVTLVNLTADGARSFVLPAWEAPVSVFPRAAERADLQARIDTITFEPDAGRFCITWRLAFPLRQNLLEIAQVLVGRKNPQWWMQRLDSRESVSVDPLAQADPEV